MPSAPHWKRIASALRTEIETGRLLPGDRLPSETDLARDWDVCRMTVHRAMDELQRQGWVLRKRRSGTFVAAKPRVHAKPGTSIAVLAFALDDFPSATYVRGIRTGLADEIDVLLCDTGEEAAREAQLLSRLHPRVDAVVLMPSCAPENTPLLQRILDAGQPLICMDRLPEALDAPAVMTANYASSLQALRVLTAGGHRRIVHFTDHRPHVSSVRERELAFLDALREVGDPQPERWVRHFTAHAVERPHYFEQLSQEVNDALFTLMHAPEPPTALFCLQDAYLAAVLEACARLHLSLPGDLELVAFNDCPLPLMGGAPPAHRLIQQAFAIGHHVGQALNLYLQGGPRQILDELPARLPAQLVPLQTAPSSRANPGTGDR